MKNISGWGIALIVLGTVLVLGLAFRFILDKRASKAATGAATTNPAGASRAAADAARAAAAARAANQLAVSDDTKTLSRLRRAV